MTCFINMPSSIGNLNYTGFFRLQSSDSFIMLAFFLMAFAVAYLLHVDVIIRIQTKKARIVLGTVM
jgi:hypothetical protein